MAATTTTQEKLVALKVADLMNHEERSAVRVLVRVAPDFGSSSHLKIDNETLSIAPTKKGTAHSSTFDTFTFDKIFPSDATQQDVHSYLLPSLERFKNDINTSFIVYGRSGTGKSFTIGTNSDDGLIQLACSKIFPGEYNVSYTELYGDEVRDLFVESSPRLTLRQQTVERKPHITPTLTLSGQVVVEGLSWHLVKRLTDFKTLFETGNSRRRLSRTLSNVTASGSHVVLIFESLSSRARLVLVDLAGPRTFESSADSYSEKERIAINTSLCTLSNVMSQLSQKVQHVSYRDSKLTRLLQPTLSGCSETNLITCISSNPKYTAETLRILLNAYSIKSLPFAKATNLSPPASRSGSRAESRAEPREESRAEARVNSRAESRAESSCREELLKEPSGSPINALRPLKLSPPRTPVKSLGDQSTKGHRLYKPMFDKELHDLHSEISLLKLQLRLAEERYNEELAAIPIKSASKHTRRAVKVLIILLVLWLCFSPI